MAFITEYYKQDRWAYDISQNIITEGEVWDEKVISQSISVIISTIFGERLFNLTFGTSVWATLFENANASTGEDLLNDVAKAIRRWEDRVTLLDADMRVILNYDENSIILSVPYIINQTAKMSLWRKKIYV